MEQIQLNSPTEKNHLYPYRLKPVVKEKVWGGRNLERVLGKSIGPGKLIGETWEAWEGCIIANGALAGTTLASAIAQDPSGILGTASQASQFPLLYKFIDANDDLSVQVHPDDAEAQLLEKQPFGKTEAWYILQAEPDARLILGFNRHVTPQEVTTSIANKTLTDLISSVPVKSGDVLFVPAGTVHAIGKGIVLAEIQENSDTTYRLYDWGRDHPDRPLHIDQSLRVLDFNRLVDPKIPTLVAPFREYNRKYLVACRYFVLELLEIHQPTPPLFLNNRFHIVSAVQGDAEIAYGDEFHTRVELLKGQTVLIPGGLGRYRLIPKSKTCSVLRTFVPNLMEDVVVPLQKAGYDTNEIGRLGGPVPEHNDVISVL